MSEETGRLADDIIINLLRENKDIKEQLWEEMGPNQKISFFIKMTNEDQMKTIVETLIEFNHEYPQILSLFWESLKKVNRIRIWEVLTQETHKLIIFEKNMLNT